MAAQAEGEPTAGTAGPEDHAQGPEAPVPGSEAPGEHPCRTWHPEVGDAVVISRGLAYLKTADPMPMLRPPDLVDSGEVGLVRERRPADQLAVRFRRGTFLLAATDLSPAPAPGG